MSQQSKKFRDVLYKLLIVVLTSSIIVWLSIFLYVTFYYAYMPAVSHTKPVHLQFSWCENKTMCSFPRAHIPLVKKGQDQLLVRGQQYKVFLDLEMPESPINQQLGMFMIKIDFASKTDQVVHSTARAAMLRYKSKLHQIFSTIFLTPLLILGSTEEKQILSIELCDYYEEDPVRPATNVIIEIQSQNIEIYSSQLRIYAHFTGLRYMMFHWPVLSAIIGIGTILFFLSIIALLSWYRYLVSHETHQVVVRVAFDDSRMKSIEERRNQVRDFLLREKQRQSKLHASFSSFEISGPVKNVKVGESLTRTHSLETLTPTGTSKRRLTTSISTVGSMPPGWATLVSPSNKRKESKSTGPKDVGGSQSKIEETGRNDKNENYDDELEEYTVQDINFEDETDSDDINIKADNTLPKADASKTDLRNRRKSKET